MATQDMKAALRAEMKRALGSLSSEQRQAESARVCARLRAQAVWQRARAVLLYAPRGDEVDVASLMAEGWSSGKIVALPRYVPTLGCYEAAQIRDFSREVQPGRFGVTEPRPACPAYPLNQLDLALVPGVCFDVNGRRLGRGKGFYDRLLDAIRGIRCGVAFDLQVRREIPAEPHDVVLDCILTPTRWICLSHRAVWK